MKQPLRQRGRAPAALLLLLAAVLLLLRAPAGASPTRLARRNRSAGRKLRKMEPACSTAPIPQLRLDDPAAVVTLDVPSQVPDAGSTQQQPFRQFQVVYKNEVLIREFPEHFMYSLGAYDPDQSDETVQVFKGGEPYLKGEDCPGPSRATVVYECKEDAPAGQEQLVAAMEAAPGSCDFRLVVQTRRVCSQPLSEL